VPTVSLIRHVRHERRRRDEPECDFSTFPVESLRRIADAPPTARAHELAQYDPTKMHELTVHSLARRDGTLISHLGSAASAV